MRLLLAVVPLVAASVLPSLPGAAAASLPAIGEEIAVGTNANGEACRLRRVRPNAGVEERRFSLYCKGWTEPSGSLTSFDAAFFKPAEYISAGGYAEQIANRLAECAPPTTLAIADRFTAALRLCRRREGGWPTAVGAAGADGRAYLFEALPTNLALIERSIAALASDTFDVLKGPPREALITQYETAFNVPARQFAVSDIGTAEELRRLGIEQGWAGRTVDAERTWRKLCDILERVFGPQHSGLGRPLAELALNIQRQDRLGEAQAIQKRAEPLARSSVDRNDYPTWLTYSAYLEDRLGHREAALAFAKQALSLRRSLYPKGGEPIAHGAYVVAYENVKLERYQEAIAPTEEALRNYYQAFGPTHPMTGRTWYQQGLAYLGLNDLGKARAAADRAFKMHDFLYGDSAPLLDDAVLVGRIALRDGRTADALAAFRRAVKAAARSSARGLRPAEWFADYLDLLLREPDGAGEAFATAQLVRGNVTDGAIQAMAVRAAAQNPEIAAAVRELQDARVRELNAHLRLAEGSMATPDEDEATSKQRLERELAAAVAEAGTAEQRIQAEFPRYAQLVQPMTASVDAVSRQLRPDEALLLARPTPKRLYLFLVRNGAVRVRQVPLPSTALAEEITELRKTLEIGAGGVRPFDVARAGRLYDALFRPVAEDLAGLRHLVYVAGGPLLSLPPALLVRDLPAGGSPAFVASDFAVSMLPSVPAFLELRQAGAAPAKLKPFIGFGDPDFIGQGDSRGGLAALGRRCSGAAAIATTDIHGLPRLPETAAELRGIAGALKAPSDSVILGPAASKAGLAARNLAQFRVVALATHGLLANDIDCQNEPALALSLPAKATSGAEGLLGVSEIVTLKLAADWVLLSACNTAGPDGLTGEALSGLTRAFFYAGARSVMATHWPVASEATVRLTTLTFQSYAQHPERGKASALRQAQLALMSDPKTAHPIFWAPFSLVGDGG